MGQPTDKKPSDEQSDRFMLDFGKNIIRMDKATATAEKPSKKQIPEPGRVAPATSVPKTEILNPSSEDEADDTQEP